MAAFIQAVRWPHAPRPSEAASVKAVGAWGAPLWGLKRGEEERHLQGRKQGGMSKSCSENFSPTVRIGPVVRLQGLAGS